MVALHGFDIALGRLLRQAEDPGADARLRGAIHCLDGLHRRFRIPYLHIALSLFQSASDLVPLCAALHFPTLQQLTHL